MLKRTLFHLAGLAFLFAALIFTGCAGAETDEPTRTASDSATTEVPPAALPASASQPEGPAEPILAVDPTPAVAPSVAPGEFGRVGDLALVDGLLYAACDAGLIRYHPVTESVTLLSQADPIGTVARFDGNLFAGGSRLYRLSGDNLLVADADLSGFVTAMTVFDEQLYVGTDDGLWRYSDGVAEQVWSDVPVTTLTAQLDRLWIGTAGSGLFDYNGDTIRRRYIQRDTAAFDDVTVLASRGAWLYVGTATGLYLYDGGRWAQRSVIDGLPADMITAIDASGWVVRIGTAAGVVGYFEDTFTPVSQLAQQEVRDLARIGTTVIAATDYDGLVVINGELRRSIVTAGDSTSAPPELAETVIGFSW